MSSASSRDVPQELAHWLRPVLLGDAEERISRRWAILDSFIRTAKVQDVSPLVLASFGFAGVTSVQLEPFISLFRQDDASFNNQDNAEEIKILCGAALGAILRLKESSQLFTALSTMTVGCAGARQPIVDIDLAGLASSTLSRVSVEQRERKTLAAAPALPKFEKEKEKEALDALAAKLQQNPGGHAVEVVTGIGTLCASFAAKTATVVSNYVQSLRKDAQSRDEELSFLSWVVNEWSSEAVKPWKEVDRSAAVAIYPVELAMLTEMIPGPPSVSAVLSRAGVSSTRKTTIPAVINSLDLEWMENRLAKNAVSDALLPFHSAVSRRLETRDESSWQAGWQAVTRIEAARKLSERDLATQVFLERMVARYLPPKA